MTREEIIKKGENQLEYTLNTLEFMLKNLEKGDIPANQISITAQRGLAQLDMLFYILDEDLEWDRYDYWFDKFMIYA